MPLNSTLAYHVFRSHPFLVHPLFCFMAEVVEATTVYESLTNEWNTAYSQIEEITPKSIFRKSIKKLDSSNRMNVTNSLRVQTPDFVYFRDPTIQTDNVIDRRSGGVATRIANKDGIWEPKLSDIGTAATHGEIKNISEKLAYFKYIKDLDFETSKVFKQENIEQEILKILRLD